MQIVFHGSNAQLYAGAVRSMIGGLAEVVLLPDELEREADRSAYASADVIVAGRFDATVPVPERLKLFQAPNAGYDSIDIARLPASAVLCNCFGHEGAIAEYVIGALLFRQIPYVAADAALRRGEWHFMAGRPQALRQELSGQTIGLLGYGHIGRAVAMRAKALGMRVHVANRSHVEGEGAVDRSFRLTMLDDFWPQIDVLVVALPLTYETRGLVDEKALARIRPGATLVNVGRGATVDEHALFEALTSGHLGFAIIDTWYRYPAPQTPTVEPAGAPFHALPNVLMTPHMAGWTAQMVERRAATIAENVRRLAGGQECLNVVWRGAAAAT